MEERIIKTKRGLYGRVNITLPMPVKTSMMELQKKLGMNKAEFLRVALMMGTAKLSENVLSRDLLKTGCELEQKPART
jgi:ADP-dependent phosphofructokinase/glucokinase